MSTTAWTITIGYTALSIVGIIILLIVYRSTRVGFHVKTAGRRTLERREGYWGIAVIAFLVIVLSGTIVQIPYWSDNSSKPVGQQVRVVGRQFAWTIVPSKIRAHVRTRFISKAVDVSHGLGLYDPDDVLIKQIQVLPDRTTQFIITLKKKGTYEIRCLEFCGVDHHLMQNQMEVTG